MTTEWKAFLIGLAWTVSLRLLDMFFPKDRHMRVADKYSTEDDKESDDDNPEGT